MINYGQVKTLNNVSAEDGVPDININQLELKTNDTFKKDEKLTTKFEAGIDEDGKNNNESDTKLFKTRGRIPNIEKENNEYKLHSNKQSMEETLIERAVRTTIQNLYDKIFLIITIMQMTD